jgi:hypothetical protein
MLVTVMRWFSNGLNVPCAGEYREGLAADRAKRMGLEVQGGGVKKDSEKRSKKSKRKRKEKESKRSSKDNMKDKKVCFKACSHWKSWSGTASKCG